MKPQQLTMTAAELQAWRVRHQLNPDAAAAQLGIARRTWFYYVSGARRIPWHIAMLCHMIDKP